jgi:hypothetical protein
LRLGAEDRFDQAGLEDGWVPGTSCVAGAVCGLSEEDLASSKKKLEVR